MKHILNTKLILYCIFNIFFVRSVLASLPYSFSEINHQQGLSNSAVLSIHQDNQGLMWFGTYGGLNCYDGRDMRVYRTDFSKGKTLDNNIISNIQSAGEDDLWIQTFGGVNLFSTDSLAVKENFFFPNEETMLHSNDKGDTWLVGNKNIYYYNTLHHCFLKVGKTEGSLKDLQKNAFVDSSGTLYTIPHNNNYISQYTVDSFGKDSTLVHVSTSLMRLHSKPVVHSFIHHGMVCFIDSLNNLYLYDIQNKSKVYIRNIGDILYEHGKILDIFSFYDDILITLYTGGILRLMASRQYAAELFRSDLRIFSSYVDRKQSILWMGTDGNGVVKMTRDNSFVTNLVLNKVAPSINGQVRGIMTDDKGNLWIGTKGDGIVQIPSFLQNLDGNGMMVHTPKERKRADEYTRGAGFYQAFLLKKRLDACGFWVGMSDSVAYYYSYQKDRLMPVSRSLGGKVTEIHDVYETKDSVLWIATSGSGMVRLDFDIDSNKDVKAVESRGLHFFSRQKELIEFSSILSQGDSILWIGSRGQGLVRFSLDTEEYQVYSLSERLGKAVDDILCLCRYSEDSFFIGTTTGLVLFKQLEDSSFEACYIGREQGLFNDMIHGIVRDDSGILWLGTNKGLIKYDPVAKGTYTYYYSKGIEIGEFSDDSYYKCPYTGCLFLGGINGLLYMDDTQLVSEYYADLILRSLKIDGDYVNMSEYYSRENSRIVLTEAQSSFVLQFAALDYMIPDIEYTYRLKGYDDKWTLYSKNNEAIFKHVPPGEYLFQVRYKKDVFDSSYKELSVAVVIEPYWYHTTAFYAILILLAAGGLCWGAYVVYRSGFFKRFRMAWVMSINTDIAVVKEEIDHSPLGKWESDFSNCTNEEQIGFVLRLLQVMEENLLQEDLGSTFLAEKMNMSPRQFYRKFKDLSGVSPSDFIKKYKMEKAAYLLLKTQFSIQEVIESVGISSRPYFYKEFTRYFGMTPKHYRETFSDKQENDK